MTETNQLNRLFLEIRSTILKHPAFIKGSGSPVDDPAYNSGLADLDRLRVQLSVCIRKLGFKENLLQIKQRALWKVAPEHRFNAPSLRAQKVEVDKQLNLALALQKEINDLIVKATSLSGVDSLAYGLQQIEEAFDAAHQAGETLAIPDRASFIHARTFDTGGIEATTILTFMAFCAFIQILKNKSKRS